ncbi:MAG: glutamate racemase [Cellvibrionaceae bacterium]|jgi:glutamate racemase
MIGVFDSGIGGLSVLREIHKLCPNVSTLYIADQNHVPYGPRSETEIQQFSDSICQYLLGRGVTVIVIACNTATAAAIGWLRKRYPTVSFVGMEPAIKPAALLTKSGKIGVLATTGTFKSQRYALLMNRYAQEVYLFENSCIGLVETIESGDINSPTLQAMLEQFIQPMLYQGIDTLILGCTHYPFVLPLIQKIIGEDIQIIDPSPAIARQINRVLLDIPFNSAPESPKNLIHEYVTSGQLSTYIPMVNRLVSVNLPQDVMRQNSVNAIHKTFYQHIDNN